MEYIYSVTPASVLMLGDFNAHNQLWGCSDTNLKGRQIEEFIRDDELCLLNTGKFTYLHPGTGSFSAIDLSICSPQFMSELEWDVEDQAVSSDHFPVIIRSNEGCEERSVRVKWKEEEADWDLFQSEALGNFDFAKNLTVSESVELFSERILGIASRCMSRTREFPRNKRVPWWNEDIRSEIKERNKLFKKFYYHPTTSNLRSFRLKQKEVRDLMEVAQKESWKNFVSSIRVDTPSKIVWDKVRRIRGLYPNSQIKEVSVNGRSYTHESNIAEQLALGFAENSNDAGFSEEQVELKNSLCSYQTVPMNTYLDELDMDFSLTELESVLGSLKDRSQLLKIHKAMILGKLEYGVVAYGSAAPSLLKKLDPVHNTGVRIATGAFKSSPVPSVLVEAGVMPLDDRRDLIRIRNWNKIKDNDISLFKTMSTRTEVRDVGKRNVAWTKKAQNWMVKSNIPENKVFQYRMQEPFWLIKGDCINVSLKAYWSRKSQGFCKDFLEKQMERYSDCCKVFVVGRREDFRSGTGIWVQGRNWIVERRESDLLSNFSLEAKSIVDACKISGSLGGNVLIVTNSRGVLESLVNFKNNNPFVAFLKDFIIKNRGFRFLWDPGILEGSVRTCILSKNAASKEYIGRDVVTVKDINRFCQDIQKGQRH
ncbi:hypothetical protein DMENIID0001_052940 [Sergentomyia squamirostris]